MSLIWALLGIALLVALFVTVARMGRKVGDQTPADLQPQRRPEPGGDQYRHEQVQTGDRDLGANINPSQTGNEADLWPDRTGARTRRELGARQATDVTFVGDRVEHKEGSQAGAEPAAQTATATAAGGAAAGKAAAPAGQSQSTEQTQSAEPVAQDIDTMGEPQSDPSFPPVQAGIRRDEQPSMHEEGPGTNAAADLAPEDKFGELQPAPRIFAPDGQPLQWHPDQHGVPGDHIRDGHHTSATAPEQQSDATDPYAHAPLPGPNHIPPEGGVDFPPNVQP
jgi:hypothetical protein